ncbi:MAG TPA: metalloregulator ArsR/SmtB family transcription factor [Acidimicrobiia bacterium]|nr:metalloregulator ArsR/SmtB family transcription factor [Acidimicrobiia bacterium]
MGRPSIIEPKPIPLPEVELAAKLFRTLGDATRLEIVEMLLNGPLHQKEIVDSVGLSQGQVSHHLSCLTWCGLISAERDGRLVEYRIANPRVVAIVDMAKAFLEHSTGDISSCKIAK